MNVDELAREAATALAERLPEAAGSATDTLMTLIINRLEESKTGTRALDALRSQPDDPAERDLAATVIADEFVRDSRFAARVGAALDRPNSQTSAVALGAGSRLRGEVAGGNIDKSKQYHIGSIRFGTGGLTALIAVGVLAAGGGGVATTAAIQQSQSDKQISEAHKGSHFGAASTSADLDEDQAVAGSGDKVADITFNYSQLTATGGAQIAPLPAGVVTSFKACTDAIDEHATRVIKNIKEGDVICIRTSLHAIVGATVSGVELGGQIISLDYAYWTA